MTKILILAAVAVLAACSSVKTRTALTHGTQISSRTGPVCMMAGSLPDGVAATRLGRIKATKGTYGETENLMLPMANEARRVGADAVVELQADIRIKGPMPWRVTAPTGDGFAVKFTDPAAPFDCVGHGGRLL